MNLFGALILTFSVMVILTASRRWALLAMMTGVLYLTLTQGLNVFGLNLFPPRFLELAGFARVMMRREFSFTKLNPTDRALIVLYSFTTIVYCLRAGEEMAYVIGSAVDAFLCYFACRGLVGNADDFRWFLRGLVVLLVPYAALVLAESFTHSNVFAFMGGMYGWTRNGRFRCVGSFRNPDLLGTLGTSFLPLYIALAWQKVGRWVACLGIGLCLIVIYASNSGGPLCATSVACLGWGLWCFRARMKLVRRLMVSGLVALAMVMKAPIWYVLARISEITGGDGWHRSYLMDISFRHLGEWWLAGMPAKNTSDWFAEGGLVTTGAADITNLFIAFGLTAGLGAMFLFILLLKRAFSSLGTAMGSIRSDVQNSIESEQLLWGLGVVLSVHIATWFGITYFDQTYVIWFIQLAAISNLSEKWAVAAVPFVPNGTSEALRRQPIPVEPKEVPSGI